MPNSPSPTAPTRPLERVVPSGAEFTVPNRAGPAPREGGAVPRDSIGHLPARNRKTATQRGGIMPDA